MNIIEAIEDANLFRPFLGDLKTWGHWMTALRVLHGLPVRKSERDLIRQCTGRDAVQLPKDGFRSALLLVGRRSGKSRISALAAAYEAALSGRERLLSPGEIGLVAVVSPTRFQSRIVRSYVRSCFESTPILQGEIVAETKEGFKLRNGVEIQTLVGDFRTVRGFTLLCAVVDEICFFHLADEGKVRTDTELIAALRPGLSTTRGRLLCIGSPYAERGWAYSAWKKHFGNDLSNTLVWRAPSRTMNPTLDQKIIDDAMLEDSAAARSEYYAEWRQDIAAFLPREVIEQLVVPGRKQLPPYSGIRYAAFADVSGGRSDDAALAIGHKEGRIVVLDCLERYKAPHNPYEVIAKIAETIRRYGCDRAIGDAYAAEFTKRAFESHGIKYERCSTSAWKTGASAKNKIAKPKNVLYAELLPRLCAGEIEMLDNDLLVTQLSSLERRTRSGGRDIIDHPAGGHDDLANVVAGVCDSVSQRSMVAGAVLGTFTGEDSTPFQRAQQRFDSEAALCAAEQEMFSSDDTQEEFKKLMRLAGRLDSDFSIRLL